MSFDRLVFIDSLTKAGVDEPVARAHADALRQAMMETVATKADLADAVQALERKIDTLDRKFDGKFDTLDRKIDSSFETLDRKFDGKFDMLDRKIEITARDLTIKGAAGLIVIASLMIGLKLFG